jgi:hypothetical protein
MLGCASARAFDLFFLGASEPQKGRGRQVSSMRSTVQVFSEETLIELLRALRRHPIFRIAIPGRSADGWAIRSGTEEPTCPA